jgi:hypothetical protein
MTMLGRKTLHIIEGEGAEHTGKCDMISNSICVEDVYDSRDGRLKPNNIMEDTVHAA